MNFYTYAVNSISSHGSAVKSSRLVKNKLLISFGMDHMINKLYNKPPLYPPREDLLVKCLTSQPKSNLFYTHDSGKLFLE
jgi:hypothetical protein